MKNNYRGGLSVPVLQGRISTTLLLFFGMAFSRADAEPDKGSIVSPAEHFNVYRDIAGETKLQLWAGSDMVRSPIAIDVDPQGRVWATEGGGEKDGIIVMEDRDGDGRADHSHVFVRDKYTKNMAMSLALFDNRIVLGNAPNIVIYTDVNRNAIYDEGVDTREVFLDGFDGRNHDHAIHSFVGAPSGQWLFSFGNKGATFKTKDGEMFSAACYYGNTENIEKKSSDGFLYLGGMTMRMNPDGTGLRMLNHNIRNPHDLGMSSFGDLFQADNDDPAHARATWAMEYANFGYADLNNGGARAWSETSKTWDEQKVVIPGISASRSQRNLGHWRESYPGTTPIGHLIGAGSPTGQVFIEGDELGKSLRGAFIIGDCVPRNLQIFHPVLKDAQFEMGDSKVFLELKPEHKKEPFFPLDVALGTDGSMFVADWVSYIYARRKGVSEEGGIYRLSRKDEKDAKAPVLDFDTIDGMLHALRNPAINVRWLALQKLLNKGNDAVDGAIKFFEDETNPYYRARVVWLLAQSDGQGRSFVRQLLQDKDETFRIVAYRALRHSDPGKVIDYASELLNDTSAFVRREVLLSLRDLSFEQVASLFGPLVKGYDGKNRWYLEAIGIAATGKQEKIYAEIIKPLIGGKSYADWSEREQNLAWRFHTPTACEDLLGVFEAQDLSIERFRLLLHAFALYSDVERRESNKAILEGLQQHPKYGRALYQDTLKEFVEKDLSVIPVIPLDKNYKIPEFADLGIKLGDVATISALGGDSVRGQVKIASCLICHQDSGRGVQFGPDLSSWGRDRTIEAIVKEIVEPSEFLAHGYDHNLRLKTGDGRFFAEGIVGTFSQHKGEVKMKVFGGTYHQFKFRGRNIDVEMEKVEASWMPTPDRLGLNNQDVRDIAEYLKRGNHSGSLKSATDTTPMLEPDSPVPVPSREAGWKPLFDSGTLEGWHNNHEGKPTYDPGTWSLVDGVLKTTGRPVGVLYSEKSYRNFELSFEWKHHHPAKNSGLFVWVKKIKSRLASGVEVQILDPAYEEFYVKAKKHRYGLDEKRWFTGHGDVFPVGVKMTPFPPASLEPKEQFRSFPSERRVKPAGQWNHYYIEAIDGTLRLSVNGKEVSGGYNIEPSFGPLAFEAEGGKVDFRNLWIRENGKVLKERKE